MAALLPGSLVATEAMPGIALVVIRVIPDGPDTKAVVTCPDGARCEILASELHLVYMQDNEVIWMTESQASFDARTASLHHRSEPTEVERQAADDLFRRFLD